MNRVQGVAPEPRRRGLLSRFWAAVDQRLGLDAFRYEVPGYANTLSYTLGGITFFGIVILAVTGVILAQFYHPHPEDANASVQAIMTQVPLGSILRSVHFWTAQAVLVSVSLHVTRVFLTAAYKKPREFNWYIGVALLATLVGFMFTGTVIKWDQEGFEALAHNIEIASFLGGVGTFFSPSFAAGVPLVSRLYSVHVSLFPLILGFLLVAHIFYIRYFGISPRPRTENREHNVRRETFLKHMKKIAFYGLVLFAIVAILAIAFPAPLGPRPIAGIEVTKPPWPFLWLFPIENSFGIQWLLPVSVLPFALLLMVPIVDRGEERNPRRRKAIVIAFLVGLAIFVALVIIGALAPMKAHLGG